MSSPGIPLGVETPGGSFAALAWGPEDGVPVLAVHGWQDHAASFARLAPRLDGYRVVAVDLAGHGRSDRRAPGASYWFLDYVVDCHAILDALGWRRPVLLGHSLGGAVVACLAAACPERARRLVLLDGFSPGLAQAEHAPARLARVLAGRAALRDSEPRRYPSTAALAARLEERLGVPPDVALLLAERGSVACEGGVMRSTDPRLAVGPPSGLSQEQLVAFLAAIRCPTLFVRPRAGFPFPRALLDVLHASVRRLELVEVPGGHHAHLTEAAAVAGVVSSFLGGARS